ncbi:octopamine receptor-like [Argopecten irradians]|uniref:octopamine receptor-like n=1 Tax=Argopecten irradians TaxID=31199 RepID=UPI00370FDBF7
MSSSNVSGLDALNTVSGSFYKWLEDDVLDNLAGVTMSVIFLLGLVLNILVIRVLYSNKHQTMTSKPIFIQLIVIDFCAYVFIILPGIVAAFSDSVIFPEGMCLINGLCLTICWLGSFVVMTILCIERTVKLCSPKFHEKSFDRKRQNLIMLIMVWIVSVTVSALPLTGYGEAVYNPLQQRCNLHGGNQIHMHILFVFGLYIPLIIVCVCGILTYTHKRQIVLSISKLNKQVESINMKLAKTAEDKNPKSLPSHHFNRESDLSVSDIIDDSIHDHFPTISETVLIQNDGKSATRPNNSSIPEPICHMSCDDTAADVISDITCDDTAADVISDITCDDTAADVISDITCDDTAADVISDITCDDTAADVISDSEDAIVSEPVSSSFDSDTKMDILSNGVNKDKTKLSKVKVMFNVYQSSAEERDVTLSVSYILMFMVVFGLWTPYVTLSYLDGGEGTVWGGWFSIVVLVSDISYCIKPVVYLSHNRVLKRAAVASFPESVRNRAAKTHAALRKISKKLDNLVFIHMPDTKSLIDIERDRVRVSPIN